MSALSPVEAANATLKLYCDRCTAKCVRAYIQQVSLQSSFNM